MKRSDLFHFDGISSGTLCGIDLNPIHWARDAWHGLTGSEDADKAKKKQEQATKMWTGGANADQIFDPSYSGNRGAFGEIPDTPVLGYGWSPDQINPYQNGPGYIADQMNPWDSGTSAYETRGPSAWGQVGDSAYAGLDMDPEARAGMEGSMSYFRGLQSNPNDAVAEADYQRAAKKAELSRRSNTEAALGNLEARGMAGSGDALLAQLTGAEGAASDTYQAGLDRAAMGAARRDSAATAAGNLAGTLGQTQAQIDEARAAGMDTQAGNRANAYDAYSNNTAGGKDAYAQWNAAHVFDTNKYNSDALTQQMKDQSTRERGVLDANTGTHNQVVQQNAAAPQQTFNNKMAALGGATGQMNTQANSLYQNAVYPLQDVILPTVSGIAKATAK